MKIDETNPLAPVDMPEFGQPVSWAMCRNPACRNFGIHYTGPAPENSGTVSNVRYSYDANTGCFRCKYCGQSFTLKSNWSIAPFARYFLKISLPFKDCSNPDCDNHSYNVFEHYTAKGLISRRRYRRDGKYRMLCRKCNRRFNLGEALQLTGTNKKANSCASKKIPDPGSESESGHSEADPRGLLKKSIRQIIEGVKTVRGVTDTIEFTGMNTSTYYKRLFRISARLCDYHAWRNARLLHKGFVLPDEPLRVYTDTLQVSLNRWGEADRYRLFDIVTSVVAVGDTYFILAAHPAFLPKPYCPTPTEAMRELGKTSLRKQWDCVLHTFNLEHSGSVTEQAKGVKGSGKKGFYGVSPYTELAHFLVVRKMLSRLRNVHYFMDGSTTLYSAALTALVPDIQAERAEIVLFQHEKDVQDFSDIEFAPALPRKDWKAKRQERLDVAWRSMQDRFTERIRRGELNITTNPDTNPDDDGELARQFKHAFKGGYSKTGSWAWLTYPPTSRHYINPRILWLTWKPGKSYEDKGRELLLSATLQPVDSAFNLLRQRVSGLHRAAFRARPGRSYLGAYWDPAVVCAELWIVLLWRNYGLRIKSPTNTPPAKLMGLTTPKRNVPDLARLAWEFRLGVEHAARMSRRVRWLRHSNSV